MNVRLLIQQSYRDAQILAETGEDASATQITTGTRLLNRIIRFLAIDGNETPLITEYFTTLESDSGAVDLPGWADIYQVQYLLGNIWTTITLKMLTDYLEMANINATSGIPIIAYALRTPTGINLRVFFQSNTSYPLRIYGYKSLGEVTTETELTDNAEFMQDYLGYRLAYDLRVYNQLMPDPNLISKIKAYEEKYNNLKPRRTDKVIHKLGDYEGRNSIAALNLGQGYKP